MEKNFLIGLVISVVIFIIHYSVNNKKCKFCGSKNLSSLGYGHGKLFCEDCGREIK